MAPLVALAAGAGAGAEDPGAGLHARPDLLDRPEAGAGLPADRLHRRHRQPLLAGAAAAGGLRRDRARACWARWLFTLLAGGAYLFFLLFVDWTRWSSDRPEISELVLRVVFLAMVGQPGQHPGGGPARAIRQSTAAPPSSWPRPTSRSARPRRRCAGPTAWPRWASSPPAWRTSCAIRWAPSRRRPRCSDRNVSAENEVAREMAGFISYRSGPHQLAGHALPAIRPAAAAAPGNGRPGARRSTARSPWLEREAPGIAIYKNYSPRSRRFRFDAELMERVFYNLVLNAAQATPARRRGHGEDARRRAAPPRSP